MKLLRVSDNNSLSGKKKVLQSPGGCVSGGRGAEEPGKKQDQQASSLGRAGEVVGRGRGGGLTAVGYRR